MRLFDYEKEKPYVHVYLLHDPEDIHLQNEHKHCASVISFDRNMSFIDVAIVGFFISPPV